MPPDRRPYRLCLMHPMDPRGAKLGGIETHVRQILTHCPNDFSVLFVGVDEFGDSPLGVVRQVAMGGRTVDFLPVAHIDQTRINLPGKSLAQSTTLRFSLGIARFLGVIRRAVGSAPASADLQRFEYAGLAGLLGLPAIQMVHGDGAKGQPMDSLTKRFWWIHRSSEWLALKLARRILCVNEDIRARLANLSASIAAKAEVMTVSVDTGTFAPRPFPDWDGMFRVVFAGRLDSFKDPPLMFRVLAKLRDRLNGRLAFHYLGTTDPHRYGEFAAIAGMTILHGFQPAAEVSRIVAGCHAGILTSYFEGMPCFLLETLSVGRPFAAIRLPQYDPLVRPGISGALVERTDPDTACCDAMVDALANLRDEIAAGRLDPDRIHRLTEPYSVGVQLQRTFAHHRAIQDAIRPAAAGGRPAVPSLRT